MKTKAAILYELNQPLRVEEIEIPALKKGQILVKIHFSGVCHSQLMEARGRRGADRYLPHLLGHEATGEVIEIGEGVTKVKPKDKVILTWIKSEGLEAGGAQYFHKNLKINAGAVTTFSEYSVVSENRCVKLPEGVPLDVGSLFGCAILTGAGMVMNVVQPKPHQTIAFFGLGGIGLSALMMAKVYECETIIAVDINEAKLKLAKEFGATHLINSSQQDPVATIFEITKNIGVDYSVEASGLAKIIEQAFQSVRKNGGLCVFASHPRYGDKIQLDPFDLICGRQIKGSWGGEVKPDRDIPKLAQFYLEGKLPIDKLISCRYSLEQINDILNDIETYKIARGLIHVG